MFKPRDDYDNDYYSATIMGCCKLPLYQNSVLINCWKSDIKVMRCHCVTSLGQAISSEQYIIKKHSDL